MAIASGSRIGPYEILAPLGAGGMGEVYRAGDPRLGREVAIKVLPSSLACDADRLRRFEQEARAAGVLNHPNILAIFDIGSHDGSPYIVFELLEGQTLRECVNSGPVPPRKGADCATQIARGLAAAHDKGIIHRDLKPENLFVTKDGRVKILDFGLAKLTRPEVSIEATGAPTVASGTDPGTILGTAGYMSPEQVRGQPADHRSDIFTLGAILYEMLSGKRAFRGDSALETMHAILKEDPPDLVETNRHLPPGLERIVRHCLEKNPEERFQSARDLAFDLEVLSGISGPVPMPVAPSASRPKKFISVFIGIVVLAAVAIGGYFAGTERGKTPSLAFRRLTFRNGYVNWARFAPDGQTIIYSAQLDGGPPLLYSTRPEGVESRPLGFPQADILSISSSGEMALLLNPSGFPSSRGTLARAPLAGGAAREILEDVTLADWAPKTGEMAVAHHVAGRDRIEFPIGSVLYETTGEISALRVSPDGRRVAFEESDIGWMGTGSVAVVDRNGKTTALYRGWVRHCGLAWPPAGDELWFGVPDETGAVRDILAATFNGKTRQIARMAGPLALHDISSKGQVLLNRGTFRRTIVGRLEGETEEHNLSWLDESVAADLSIDGRSLLFSETGAGGGMKGAVYFRKANESHAIRLGDGKALALSPDGKQALSLLRTFPPQLSVLPTGAGEARIFKLEGFDNCTSARWLADGSGVLFNASESGHGLRCYLMNLEDGKPRPVTPESFSGSTISPDGKVIAVTGPDQKTYLYPLEGGQRRPAPGLDKEELPVQWSADGRYLYVWRRRDMPHRIYRVEISTGKKEVWKEIRVPDPTGVVAFETALIAPDGKSYACTYARVLADLYLVEGW